MTSRAAALLVAGGLLVAGTAAAEPPAPAAPAPSSTHPIAEALQVEPNGCFDAVSLASSVSRWLQRDTVDRRLTVEVFGQPGGFEVLQLRVWRDDELVGERRFPSLSASCEEIRAAVGLAAALAIDATVLESLGVRPLPPLPPSRPGLSPPTLLPGLSASLDAGVLFGVLPSPVVALAPGFGLRLAPAVELRLSGLVTAAGALTLDGRSLGVTLLAGRADACSAISTSIARARACAGLAAGRLHATLAGQSPTVAVSPSAPWVGAIAHADVRVSLAPWFGLVLGADTIVPLNRPHFEVSTRSAGPDSSGSVPVIGGAVTFGSEITFR